MKKALIYSVAVCGLSWLAALIFHLTTGYSGPESGVGPTMTFQKFAMAYMFLPAIVAFIMQALDGRMKVIRPHSMRMKLTIEDSPLIKFRPRWSWLAALLLVPATVALSILLSALFAQVVPMDEGAIALIAAQNGGEIPHEAMEQLQSLPKGAMLLVTLLSGLFAGVTINAFFAFGEEYGWRCYMVETLQERGFLPAAALIGAVWGLWHAPMILMGHNGYPNRPIGVVMMILFCLLAGVVELYFVCKSGTLWPATIFHGTINALAGIGVLMIPTGNALLTGMTGIAGLIALAIIITLLYLYDKYVSREVIFSSTLGHSLNRHLR